MKELLKRFMRSLTIFTAALALSGFAFSYFTQDLISKYWPFILMLVAGITLIIVALLFSASEQKFSRFSNTFMIASMSKILLLLIVMSVYAYANPSDGIRFSVSLLVFYVCYLVFEIVWLLKLQNLDKK
jgi:ABC-type xylose transport system permease subunit